MPNPTNALYFVAIVPPSPLEEELLAIKEYVKENYKSRAALNSPPHITLHMPFEWKEKKEEYLTKRLAEFTALHTRFTVVLDNFGAFEPRVIFVRVAPSPELTGLHNELHRFFKTKLAIFNARYRDLPFHPHLTVAFRDLRKEKFLQAWQVFKVKPFAASFECTTLNLLKNNGRRWEIWGTFALQ